MTPAIDVELTPLISDEQVQELRDVLANIERAKAWHEAEAVRLGGILTGLRDALNGRTRKPKTGKFSRKRRDKTAPPVGDPGESEVLV